MFTLPESTEPLRVLAIDPGSYNTGIAQLEWNYVTESIEVCNAFTLKFPDSGPSYLHIRELTAPRIARLHQMEDELTEIMDEFKPHLVIAESNYMGRFADAYATLVECVAVIRNVLYRYDPTMPLLQVDPPTAKKDAGVKGRRSEKIDVAIALKQRKEIVWSVNIDDLDEHSVDAVAVGYHVMRLIRNSPDTD